MSEIEVIFTKIRESNKINEEIIINTKLLYVFDKRVILIKNENNVFCSGDSSHQVLGLGHQNPVEDSAINEELSNKQAIDNSCGQLGINYGECEDNKLKRTKIEVAIKKISCGHEHSLLICSESAIYAFGWNDYEQDGRFTCKEQLFNSMKMNHFEKVIQSTPHYQNDTSVTLSENGFYYVWGKCGNDGMISEPEDTEPECFEDVLAEFLGITVKSLQYSSHMIYYFIPSGKYEINWNEIAKIGKGGYGKVFKVKHKLVENTISAMKKIPIKEGNTPTKELVSSSLILTLDSDYLVRYYDVWYENDFTLTNGFRDYTEKYTIYIEMDLCDKTLKEIKQELKEYPILFSKNLLTPLGYYVLSGMFAEVFEGVNYLHNKSIIHRDLNPFNILVKMGQNGNCIKIADFNLAVVHQINKLHTSDRGHANYAAPEQLKSREYDTKADIYNLGITLEEMFDIDYNKSNNDYFDIKSKYDYLKELIQRMTLRIPQNRPNCEQILEERENWALNENEFDFHEELDFLLGINNGNRSYVQNLVVSRLTNYIIENFWLSL